MYQSPYFSVRWIREAIGNAFWEHILGTQLETPFLNASRDELWKHKAFRNVPLKAVTSSVSLP